MSTVPAIRVVTNGLTSEEDEELVRLLLKAAAGRSPGQPMVMSRDVSDAIGQVAAVISLECVVLRRRGGRIETLLIPRPDNCRMWRGKVHAPGTLVRVGDLTHRSAITRMALNELGVDFSRVVKVGIGDPVELGRKCVNQIFHLCLLDQDPPNGTWHDVQALPENIVPEHRRMIARVAYFFDHNY